MSHQHQQTLSSCNVSDDHLDDDSFPDSPAVHCVYCHDTEPRLGSKARYSPPAEHLYYYHKYFGQAACQCRPYAPGWQENPPWPLSSTNCLGGWLQPALCHRSMDWNLLPGRLQSRGVHTSLHLLFVSTHLSQLFSFVTCTLCSQWHFDTHLQINHPDCPPQRMPFHSQLHHRRTLADHHWCRLLAQTPDPHRPLGLPPSPARPHVFHLVVPLGLSSSVSLPGECLFNLPQYSA